MKKLDCIEQKAIDAQCTFAMEEIIVFILNKNLQHDSIELFDSLWFKCKSDNCTDDDDKNCILLNSVVDLRMRMKEYLEHRLFSQVEDELNQKNKGKSLFSSTNTNETGIFLFYLHDFVNSQKYLKKPSNTNENYFKLLSNYFTSRKINFNFQLSFDKTNNDVSLMLEIAFVISWIALQQQSVIYKKLVLLERIIEALKSKQDSPIVQLGLGVLNLEFSNLFLALKCNRKASFFCYQSYLYFKKCNLLFNYKNILSRSVESISWERIVEAMQYEIFIPSDHLLFVNSCLGRSEVFNKTQFKNSCLELNRQLNIEGTFLEIKDIRYKSNYFDGQFFAKDFIEIQIQVKFEKYFDYCSNFMMEFELENKGDVNHSSMTNCLLKTKSENFLVFSCLLFQSGLLRISNLKFDFLDVAQVKKEIGEFNPIFVNEECELLVLDWINEVEYFYQNEEFILEISGDESIEVLELSDNLQKLKISSDFDSPNTVQFQLTVDQSSKIEFWFVYEYFVNGIKRKDKFIRIVSIFPLPTISHSRLSVDRFIIVSNSVELKIINATSTGLVVDNFKLEITIGIADNLEELIERLFIFFTKYFNGTCNSGRREIEQLFNSIFPFTIDLFFKWKYDNRNGSLKYAFNPFYPLNLFLKYFTKNSLKKNCSILNNNLLEHNLVFDYYRFLSIPYSNPLSIYIEKISNFSSYQNEVELVVFNNFYETVSFELEMINSNDKILWIGQLKNKGEVKALQKERVRFYCSMRDFNFEIEVENLKFKLETFVNGKLFWRSN